MVSTNGGCNFPHQAMTDSDKHGRLQTRLALVSSQRKQLSSVSDVKTYQKLLWFMSKLYSSVAHRLPVLSDKHSSSLPEWSRVGAGKSVRVTEYFMEIRALHSLNSLVATLASPTQACFSWWSSPLSSAQNTSWICCYRLTLHFSSGSLRITST